MLYALLLSSLFVLWCHVRYKQNEKKRREEHEAVMVIAQDGLDRLRKFNNSGL